MCTVPTAGCPEYHCSAAAEICNLPYATLNNKPLLGYVTAESHDAFGILQCHWWYDACIA